MAAFKKYLLLLASLVVFTGCAHRGSAGSWQLPTCVDPAEAADWLEHLGPLFFDTENEDLLESSGLRIVAATEPSQTLVHQCSRYARFAANELNDVPYWRERGYSIAPVRFGPYVAIPVIASPVHNGIINEGRTLVLVLDRRSGQILVNSWLL
jgi:hypothetical protein